MPFVVIARSEESRRTTNDEAIPLTYGCSADKGIASSPAPTFCEKWGAPRNDKVLVTNMSDTKQILNIVDENDNIIGQESREKIHNEGLLHREINVWFYNNKGEAIFQLRGMDQETYPGLLDATAGGHVEIGDSYKETAVKELEEETGLKVKVEDLKFFKKEKAHNLDPLTKTDNYRIKAHYLYEFDGNINNLTAAEGQGFEAWLADKILNISNKDKAKFIPSILEEAKLEIFKQIQEFIK